MSQEGRLNLGERALPGANHVCPLPENKFGSHQRPDWECGYCGRRYAQRMWGWIEVRGPVTP